MFKFPLLRMQSSFPFYLAACPLSVSSAASFVINGQLGIILSYNNAYENSVLHNLTGQNMTFSIIELLFKMVFIFFHWKNVVRFPFHHQFLHFSLTWQYHAYCWTYSAVHSSQIIYCQLQVFCLLGLYFYKRSFRRRVFLDDNAFSLCSKNSWFL